MVDTRNEYDMGSLAAVRPQQAGRARRGSQIVGKSLKPVGTAARSERASAADVRNGRRMVITLGMSPQRIAFPSVTRGV